MHTVHTDVYLSTEKSDGAAAPWPTFYALTNFRGYIWGVISYEKAYTKM